MLKNHQIPQLLWHRTTHISGTPTSTRDFPTPLLVRLTRNQDLLRDRTNVESTKVALALPAQAALATGHISPVNYFIPRLPNAESLNKHFYYTHLRQNITRSIGYLARLKVYPSQSYNLPIETPCDDQIDGQL